MKIVVYSDQLTEPLRAALSPRDTTYRSDLNGGHDNADVIVYALQLDADGYQMLRDSRDKTPDCAPLSLRILRSYRRLCTCCGVGRPAWPMIIWM